MLREQKLLLQSLFLVLFSLISFHEDEQPRPYLDLLSPSPLPSPLAITPGLTVPNFTFNY